MAAANPGRVELEAIEAERRELSPGGFARERLNIWPADGRRGGIRYGPSGRRWCHRVRPREPRCRAIGVDASPQPGRVFAIVGCWRCDDDRYHVELDRVGYMDCLDALEWVTHRAGRRTPVVIDRNSPATDLIDLRTARKYNVIGTTASDMSRACGGFLNDVAAGRLTHCNEAPLNAAVAGAHKRAIGEAGAFGWDRRDGSVFLAPLVAATLARFGAVSARRTGGATFA